MTGPRRLVFKSLIYFVLLAMFFALVWTVFHLEPVTQRDF